MSRSAESRDDMAASAAGGDKPIFPEFTLDALFRAALERLRQDPAGYQLKAFPANEDPKKPHPGIFVSQCAYIDRAGGLFANTNQMPGEPEGTTIGAYFKRLLIDNLPKPVSLSTLQKELKELAARAPQSAASPEHKTSIAILQNTGNSFNLATHLATTPSRVLFAQGASQENFLEETRTDLPAHPTQYLSDTSQGPGIQEHNALMAMALHYAAQENGDAARSLSEWWDDSKLSNLLEKRQGYVVPQLGKEAAFVEALRNSKNLDAVRTFVAIVEPYGDPSRQMGIALNYGLPLTSYLNYDWYWSKRNDTQQQAMRDAARLLIIQQYQTTTTAAAIYALQHPEKEVVVAWTSVGAGVFKCDLKWCIEGEIASIVALEQYNIPNLTVCHTFYKGFEPDYSKKLNELISAWENDRTKKQEVAVAIRLRDAVRLETSNVQSYETMDAAISASNSSTSVSFAAPAMPVYAPAPAAPVHAHIPPATGSATTPSPMFFQSTVTEPAAAAAQTAELSSLRSLLINILEALRAEYEKISREAPLVGKLDELMHKVHTLNSLDDLAEAIEQSRPREFSVNTRDDIPFYNTLWELADQIRKAPQRIRREEIMHFLGEELSRARSEVTAPTPLQQRVATTIFRQPTVAEPPAVELSSPLRNTVVNILTALRAEYEGINPRAKLIGRLDESIKEIQKLNSPTTFAVFIPIESARPFRNEVERSDDIRFDEALRILAAKVKENDQSISEEEIINLCRLPTQPPTRSAAP